MSAETTHSNETNEPDDDEQTSLFNEEKAALDLITSSISVCISKGDTAMTKEVTEAARKYYLSIVNNTDMSIDQKRHKIYQDLVIGTKISLNSISHTHDMTDMAQNPNTKLSFTYRIGLDTDVISSVSGQLIVVGQYKENDICVQSNHVSRIHCFIFQINDKLIILDGWSKCGTKTINIAHDQSAQNWSKSAHASDLNSEEKDSSVKHTKTELISSSPAQRNILQYNVSDTIHIQLGSSYWGTHIVLNPKTCIVCTEKARTIRLKCGHQILCNGCYAKIKHNKHSQCPICRQPFSDVQSNKNKLVHLSEKKQNNNDTIQPKISAGVHTFADKNASENET